MKIDGVSNVQSPSQPKKLVQKTVPLQENGARSEKVASVSFAKAMSVAMDSDSFDAKKVNEVKRAIERGEFSPSPEKIASKMLSETVELLRVQQPKQK